MAFPAAHFSLGLGVATALGQKFTSSRWVLFWALVSVLPDFDFFFVFVLGFSKREYHRTFTHSIVFSFAASVFIFLATKRAANRNHDPGKTGARAFWLAIFLVLLSHVALDFLCVSDYQRDGEMLFWPFDRRTYGYRRFLVPLYLKFGGQPRHYLEVAIPYTLLEIILWSPVTIWVLWKQKNRLAELPICPRI